MEAVIFVSPTSTNLAELQNAVTSLGGEWEQFPTLQHGVVSGGGGNVFIYAPKATSDEYDVDTLAQIETALGAKPVTAICIDIGHGDTAPTLATDVGQKFIELWRGMVDGNGVIDDLK
jgi:hypothetical protein